MYVTDSIFYAMREKMLPSRYYDIIHQSQKEEKSGDEIAMDIITKLKGG